MASPAVTVSPAGTVSVAPPLTPAPVGSGAPMDDVKVNGDGRIAGIDGMLNQIAAALAAQAIPRVRQELLPPILADREMQATIGRAAGEAVARKLRPYAVVGALALVTIAGVQVAKYRLKRAQADRAASLGAGPGADERRLNPGDEDDLTTRAAPRDATAASGRGPRAGAGSASTRR